MVSTIGAISSISGCDSGSDRGFNGSKLESKASRISFGKLTCVVSGCSVSVMSSVDWSGDGSWGGESVRCGNDGASAGNEGRENELELKSCLSHWARASFNPSWRRHLARNSEMFFSFHNRFIRDSLSIHMRADQYAIEGVSH